MWAYFVGLQRLQPAYLAYNEIDLLALIGEPFLYACQLLNSAPIQHAKLTGLMFLCFLFLFQFDYAYHGFSSRSEGH